ncbi:hypothetical protein RJ640_002242 [Escallonia rubra]|uniref:Subtilisin-like protease fibronectin type-III domain-containing protein n=1 Tax=Escallonia rubra TaxID=112253 RepID=A0AA88R420_9ASTE|nr:hypothetical protein RJ640_002242 [Escallonia rubra]
MARIVNPKVKKVTVTVQPRKLVFRKALEKQSYTLKFTSNYAVNNNTSSVEQMVFGSVRWESDKHQRVTDAESRDNHQSSSSALKRGHP